MRSAEQNRSPVGQARRPSVYTCGHAAAMNLQGNLRPRPLKTLPVCYRWETLAHLAKHLPETRGQANMFFCQAGNNSKQSLGGGPFTRSSASVGGDCVESLSLETCWTFGASSLVIAEAAGIRGEWMGGQKRTLCLDR